MITFENRIRYEYKIKTARVDTLVKSILTHRDPKSQEAKDASRFLDVLIAEIDRFYEENSDLLSKKENYLIPVQDYQKIKSGRPMQKNIMKKSS